MRMALMANDPCAIVRPLAFASLSRINTRAAAPSEMEDAFAAVTVPSFAKAGRNVGIFSGRAFLGCSSSETTVSPLRVLIVTGAISASNAPDFLRLKRFGQRADGKFVLAFA